MDPHCRPRGSGGDKSADFPKTNPNVPVGPGPPVGQPSPRRCHTRLCAGEQRGPSQGEAGQGPGSYSGPIGAVTGHWGIGSVLRWLPLPRGGLEGNRLDGAVPNRSPFCPHCPLTFSPTFSPTLCFSHSGILTVPETHQAHSCLRGFAQAAPCPGVPLTATPSAQHVFTPSRSAHTRPSATLSLFIPFTISSADSNLVLVYSNSVVS